MMDFFHVKNEELCIKNEEFCIKNDEFCSERNVSDSLLAVMVCISGARYLLR